MMAPLSLRRRAVCSLALMLVQAVLSKLTITHNSSSAHATIELKCISSEPVTRFEWMKGNITAVAIYKLSSDNSSLYIPDAVYDDCGDFTCIARNNGHVEQATFKLVVDGILPSEYRIITVAIIGLGCMLTSVSAFMLSTMFRYTAKKVQKFLTILCLIFLMASLLMLLLATILWIVKDGWIIDAVCLLVFSLIFTFTPVAAVIGKLMGRCQRLWSNSWLPILVAMFVHVTIITTVILIMGKYQNSEEGCASEWPLIHRLLGALASPFILCMIVFIYKNPDVVGEPKPPGRVEIAAVSTTAVDGTSVTSPLNTSGSPIHLTLPITPAPSTWTTAPATTDDVSGITTLATHTPLTSTRPTSTFTEAITHTFTTITTCRNTDEEPAQPSTPIPVGVAEQEDEAITGGPHRHWRGPGEGARKAAQDFMALMSGDESSRTEEAEMVALGDLFADVQTAMADMQASFHGDLHNMHRSMQSDLVDLESKIQTGFTGLQCVLQDGIAEHLTALRAGLDKIQDALCVGLSGIRDAIHIGLHQGDSSIQKLHTVMLEGLAQISEETDSVVSLLTEVLENQRPSQSSQTEASENKSGIREDGDTVTNRATPSMHTGFSMDVPSHISSTKRCKTPVVPARKSSRTRKGNMSRYKW